MSEHLKYDAHNHSFFSDGHESPEEIVEVAATRVDYIGLSDHDNVRGIPRFLDAVKRVNDRGINLRGVPSAEITTSIGHMILAVPDPSMTEGFLKWAREVDFFNIDPAAAIVPGVSEFNGVCIFTHPSVPLTQGASFTDIERLIDRLPPETHGHIGIETNNHSAHMLPNYGNIRTRTEAWNQNLGLAQVAATDSHSKHLAGAFYSLLPGADTGEPIVEAFRSRSVIAPGRSVSLGGKLKILLSHGSEHLKYKTGLDVYPLARRLL